MVSRFLALSMLMGYLCVASPILSCTKSEEHITVGSFNVKWLGYYDTERDDEGLAALMKDCDVGVIQELVAPPDMTRIGKPVNWPADRGARYPNGEAFKLDDGATQFFEAIQTEGFDRFVLSEEDTGPGDTHHKNNAATECFVAFYKSTRLINPWDDGGDTLQPAGIWRVT